VSPRRLLVLSFLAAFCDVNSEPLPSEVAAATALDVLVPAVNNAPSDVVAMFDGSKVVSANVADGANDVVLASGAGVRLPVVLTVTEFIVEGMPISVVVPSKISGTSTTVTCPILFVCFILTVRIVIDGIVVSTDSPPPLSVVVIELESAVSVDGPSPAIASALDIMSVGMELPVS